MYDHFPFQNVMIQSQNRGSLHSTTSFTTEVDQGEPRLFGEAPQQHHSLEACTGTCPQTGFLFSTKIFASFSKANLALYKKLRNFQIILQNVVSERLKQKKCKSFEQKIKRANLKYFPFFPKAKTESFLAF